LASGLKVRKPETNKRIIYYKSSNRYTNHTTVIDIKSCRCKAKMRVNSNDSKVRTQDGEEREDQHYEWEFRVL